MAAFKIFRAIRFGFFRIKIQLLEQVVVLTPNFKLRINPLGNYT